jgi:hypothetical protein
MSDTPIDTAVTPLVSDLFARLDGQLRDLALSEQQRRAELEAGAGSITDPAQKVVIEAAIAQHAGLAHEASGVSAALAAAHGSVLEDLRTLIAVAARAPANPPAPDGETPEPEQPAEARLMNVVLGGSAHSGAEIPAAPGVEPSAHLAAGYRPLPEWNLTYRGGPTIAELNFVNRYLGGAATWTDDDIKAIDWALENALTDARLETVVAQYFPGGPITSTMLPSAVVEGNVPPTVYKDTADTLARQLYDAGALGDAAPANSVICIMLPRGVVLSDAISPGYQPAEAEAEAYVRRSRGVIRVDEDDALDSRGGLAGYHGSIHLEDGRAVYYAIGVYSATDPDGSMNGLDVFDEPWKNVAATFYHELNEARTDPAVDDANATGNLALLGWYSDAGQGEIGDLPINDSQDWKQAFVEVPLANGDGIVPIQMMWSNADGGPAISTETQ